MMCSRKYTPQAIFFGKISLKAIRDTFFSICVLRSGEGQGNSIFLWE